MQVTPSTNTMRSMTSVLKLRGTWANEDSVAAAGQDLRRVQRPQPSPETLLTGRENVDAIRPPCHSVEIERKAQM